MMKQILVRSIKLAEKVIKSAKEAIAFKDQCYEIKYKTEKLIASLRQLMIEASSEFYERPVRVIIPNTEQVFNRALTLVLRCCDKRVCLIIPASAFGSVSNQLQSSVGDVIWLQGTLFAGDDLAGVHLSLPPIAFNNPKLSWTWASIAVLFKGSTDDRYEATTWLLSLSLDSDHSKKLIIEEGGVVPLLKVLKQGRIDEQVNAAKAIGNLGYDPDSIEHIVDAGVCSVFAKILKEGPMKVQAEVAWAVTHFARNYPICQDKFTQHNIIRLLIKHLTFDVVHEHTQNAVVINKATSVLAIVMAMNHLNSRMENEYEDDKPDSHTSFQSRDLEDPETKANMKAMAAAALRQLAKGNPTISRIIAESRALMCFVVLLDQGRKDIRYNSAMALMEITAMAEEDTDLRRYAFKPSSPAYKAIIDQLMKVIEEIEDSDLVIPCIKAVGNLARTFRATETKIIAPLVGLLDENEDEVLRETLIALTKFTCEDNYLHVDHSKTIISAGGAKHLIQLLYFGGMVVKLSALHLLCQISQQVPDSKELVEANVLTALEWASTRLLSVTRNETLESLLQEAKSRLEIYQPRG